MLIVSGSDTDQTGWLQGYNVASQSSDVDLVWEREIGATVADRVDLLPQRLVYNVDGFAGWNRTDAGVGITRFNPQTGLAEII